MKNWEKENYSFIYDRTTGEKIPVSKKIQDEYDKKSACIRQKEQAYGHCICPQSKGWACDGDCLLCEYHHSDDLISLNAPICEDGGETLLDMVPSEAPAIESIVANRDLIDRIFARLRELDPDADTITAMWMEDNEVSDRTIAKALGRPWSTFANQMRKYRAEFRRIRGY